MALQLNTELTNGIIGNYWRITNINTQVDGKTLVELCLYLNKQTRDQNKDFLFQRHLELEIDKEILINGNVFEECYSKIKELEEWSEANDV